MVHRKILFLCLLIGMVYSGDVFSQAQGTNTDFGKNRVQYKDFQWFYYRSPFFDTYYYKNGKELGATVGKLAEQNLKEIENLLDYKLDGRIKILTYNKLSDLRQTNLGLSTQTITNTGGFTEIVGNKIFVYFDGNTANLRKQIRAGIAQVLINQMLYGGNIQEMVSNSTLLTLPDWFMPGLISYIAEDWNIEQDNQLKEGIINGRYRKFNRLVNEDPRLAGHSIWKYVIDNHGPASVSNIIYMTRVNKNAESGFLYILGMNFKELSPQWFEYYQGQYNKVEQGKNLPADDARFSHKKKMRTRKLNYQQFKVSPDGKSYAYVVNRNGKFSVYVYDAQTEKTKKVFRAGLKTPGVITEKSYPVIAWHPNGILLAISYEKKSNPLIQVINLKSKKDGFEVKMYKYEKILDFDYSQDGRKWVLSAVSNGQSDIYVFDILSRRDERITDDWYDDLNPKFIQRSSKIVFSSNRDQDSLKKKVRFMQLSPFNNFDLYVYDYGIRDPELSRITNTPFINEIKPVEYDSARVAYLSDESGINNRNMAVFDSVIAYQYDTTIFWYDTTISVYRDTFTTYPATSYKRNIIDQDISKKTRRLSEILSIKKQQQLFVGQRESGDTVIVSKTPYRLKKEKSLEAAWKEMLEKQRLDSIAKADSIRLQEQLLNPQPGDSLLRLDSIIPVQEDAYYFQTEFAPLPVDSQEQSNTSEPVVKKDEFSKEKIPSLDDYFTRSSPVPYMPIFSTNYVVAQLDNNSLFNSYQPFTGSGPIYYNSNINALIKMGTSDLMEDYRFSGGFRLSGNLTIPEYYLSFENLKRRLDKQLIFYKSTENYSPAGFDNLVLRGNTYEFRGILKWPFNEQAALKLTMSYRREDYALLSTDPFTLRFPNYYLNDVGYKLEYIYDNTISTGLNLFNGTRYKFYVEQYKTLDVKGANMMNLGFDFRHYEKIHRQIIFAGRVAGSTSIAREKVMYYLGGVDSWIVPSFNRDIQIDQQRIYKYQALATNMRGFVQNIRNGNNYMVMNAEIRVPVFTYLLNRPIKSDFVKNFQIVPFTDVGAAWVGSDPFSEENRFNKIEVQPYPIKVTAIQTKYPIVGGFGAGARTRILGYFVRFDTAWGVENNKVTEKPVYYFSLSLDF